MNARSGSATENGRSSRAVPDWVQANIGELEIELRVIGKTADAGQGGPYDSLLASAGTAEALGEDIARNKRAHLADVYAPKRNGR